MTRLFGDVVHGSRDGGAPYLRGHAVYLAKDVDALLGRLRALGIRVSAGTSPNSNARAVADTLLHELENAEWEE